MSSLTVWEAFWLGLVQGLTEFLPVSSSGHLVLFQQVFDWHATLTFDVLLHMATLVAIVTFFGKSLFKVSRREWLLVLVGTIPAGVAGVLFKDQIEALFANDVWVGWELVATGVINLVTDRRLNQLAKLQKPTEPKIEHQLSLWDSIWMGVGQAVAIVPGISRSGTTVATGIWRRVDREAAFRFSFLLAIPALAGAGLLQVKDTTAAEWAQLPLIPVVVGCTAALLSGLASLIVFRWVIQKARLEWFGWYCVVVGIVAIWWLR